MTDDDRSAFHGWVIRPSARTDYQVVGKPAKDGELNHDLANPSYGNERRMCSKVLTALPLAPNVRGLIMTTRIGQLLRRGDF